jgi:hypothetical protein
LLQFADEAFQLLLEGCGLDDSGYFRGVTEDVVLVQKLQRHLLARRVQVGSDNLRNLKKLPKDQDKTALKLYFKR